MKIDQYFLMKQSVKAANCNAVEPLFYRQSGTVPTSVHILKML